MTSDDPRLTARTRGAEGQDYAGTPRPDAILPALDKDQLAALGEVGREWDRGRRAPGVAAGAAGRPALGEYPRGL